MANKDTWEIWHPARYTDDQHRAIQTLVLYAQSAVTPPPPGQDVPVPSSLDVKRALDWIIHEAAQTYESGFLPNDPNGRFGAFIEGRRSVGLQIVKLAKLKIEKAATKDRE